MKRDVSQSKDKYHFCSDVQPDDYAQFYGFSQYARELNELTPDLMGVLPPTDTRFRPDQRYLLFLICTTTVDCS